MVKLLKMGGWYLIYEIASTLVFLAVAFAVGVRIPVL